MQFSFWEYAFYALWLAPLFTCEFAHFVYPEEYQTSWKTRKPTKFVTGMQIFSIPYVFMTIFALLSSQGLVAAVMLFMALLASILKFPKYRFLFLLDSAICILLGLFVAINKFHWRVI